MLISSWVESFRRKLELRGKRKPRRRAEIIGMCAQVQELEARAMLSAPTVTLSPAGPLNYAENSGAVVVAGNSTVADAGVTNFNGATLTESLTANANPADQLGIQNQGTGAGQVGLVGTNVQYGGVTIGTETGGTGATPLVVTFNGNATIAAITAVQDNITFQTTADSSASVSAPRTFQSVFSEPPGGNVSTPVTETINILEANPVVNLNQSSLNITNSSARPIAPNATITSTETHNLNGGTLTISLTNGTSRDRLSILSHGASRAIRTSGNTVLDNGVAIGTFTGGEGSTPLVITFNSNATFADAQQLLQSVEFRSIGHFAHQTDVNVQLTDGDGGVSSAVSLSLDIIHGHSGNTGPGAPAHHGKG